MTNRERELMKEIEILKQQLEESEMRWETLHKTLAEVEGSSFYTK